MMAQQQWQQWMQAMQTNLQSNSQMSQAIQALQQNPEIMQASQELGRSFARIMQISMDEEKKHQTTHTNLDSSNDNQIDNGPNSGINLNEAQKKHIKNIKSKIHALDICYDVITILISFSNSIFNFLSIFCWYQYNCWIFYFLLVYFIIADGIYSFMIINIYSTNNTVKGNICRSIMLFLFRPLLPSICTYGDGYINNNVIWNIFQKIFDIFNFNQMTPNIDHREEETYCNQSESFFVHFYYWTKRKIDESTVFRVELMTETIPHCIFTLLLMTYYNEISTILVVSIIIAVLSTNLKLVGLTQTTSPLLWLFTWLSLVIEYISWICFLLSLFFVYNNSLLFIYKIKIEFFPALFIFIMGFAATVNGKWYDFQYSTINYSNIPSMALSLTLNVLIFLLKLLVYVIFAVPFAFICGNILSTFYVFYIKLSFMERYFAGNDFLWIQIFQFITNAKLYHSRLYKLLCGNMVRDKIGKPDVIKKLCVVNYFLSGKAGCNNNDFRKYFEENETNNYSKIMFNHLLNKNSIYTFYSNRRCDDGQVFRFILCFIYVLIKMFALFFPFYALNLFWSYLEDTMDGICVDECKDDEYMVYDNDINLFKMQFIFTIIYGLLLVIWFILVPFVLWFIYISSQIVAVFHKSSIYYKELSVTQFGNVCEYFYNHLPNQTTKIYNILKLQFGSDIPYVILDYIQHKMDVEWRNKWLDKPKSAERLY